MPDGNQGPEHGFGIAKADDGAQESAQQSKSSPFEQQEFSNLSRGETERQQCADFCDALFEAKLKEKRHQQQGGCDEEKAEPEEKLAEVLGLVNGLQRLLAEWFETEAYIRRS